MPNVMLSTKLKAVGVPTNERLRNLFPEAQHMEFHGQNLLILPHKPTETFWLRKLGFTVPAPILSYYDFPHPPGQPPFDVQKKTCALMTMEPHSYVLNGMGTGKTRATLWAWDYLRSNNACGKLLITATLSTLDNTWAGEVFRTLPHRKCAVLHHATRARRLERLAQDDVEIFIINHDGVKLIGEEILARKDIDVLAIDEIAKFRNGSADRTKYMRRFAGQFKWVWGLTGEPIPTSPTDVWAQASIVTPHTVPKYFGTFRSMLMLKDDFAKFKWTPKQDAKDRAFAALQPAVRFALDDVVELPDCVERTVDIPMGPQQSKIYKDMVKAAQVSIQGHDITAVNAGVVMSKLLQISLGWIYNKDGDIITLDNDARLKAVIDIVTSASNKILCFSPYKHALGGVANALDKEGVEYATVSGDTPLSERSQIFNLFQNTDKYKILNAHPECLAHGLTLTAADTIIWNGPVTSLEVYSQANARIRRVGQKNKQLILHLQSTPIERKVYNALKEKKQIQDMLLQLFEDASENAEY